MFLVIFGCYGVLNTEYEIARNFAFDNIRICRKGD